MMCTVMTILLLAGFGGGAWGETARRFLCAQGVVVTMRGDAPVAPVHYDGQPCTPCVDYLDFPGWTHLPLAKIDRITLTSQSNSLGMTFWQIHVHMGTITHTRGVSAAEAEATHAALLRQYIAWGQCQNGR
jgi:hypothetical protein